MAEDMGDPNKSARYAKGMATRREVLGEAHVDASDAGRTEFNDAFLTLITESAWGHVWSRPNWTRRERSMVTIALLAGLGHHEELAMHVKATANTGASADDIREALLHVAIYAGVPAANAAMKIAGKALDEMAGGT
jgi:4-carboxymuconolactone decarboxylase